jgi:ectoine hydroxylase-related dioxygenase (phytanoyl-CoA dioxygenase family)
MKNVLVVLVVLVLLSILLRRSRMIEHVGTLDLNGFTRAKVFDDSDVEYLRLLVNANKHEYSRQFILNHPRVKKFISDNIGPDYKFQDYSMYIKNSPIHTCHKDNNSQIFNDRQKHPSYTVLFYLYPMDGCLSVIDGSHTLRNEMYLTDPTSAIDCDVGDAILFDASLTHSGSVNNADRPRIQMKLTHLDDIPSLDFFENYRKTLDKKNHIPESVQYAQKHLTCQLPIISDVFYDTKKAPTDYTTFNTLFYGRTDFYN